MGYFDSTNFDPGAFDPLQPNSSFANTTRRDAYWGAKIVAAFRDEHIDAIVAEGGYRQPGAGQLLHHLDGLRKRCHAAVGHQQRPLRPGGPQGAGQLAHTPGP